VLADADTQCWIPVTVLLELGWVLRKQGAPTTVIVEQLRAVLALPGVQVQLPDRVAQAFRWAEQGLDLADALHLALSGDADRFATFDENLAARAARLGTRPPVVRTRT
jgi:predicted nucleic acid-binding protein